MAVQDEAYQASEAQRSELVALPAKGIETNGSSHLLFGVLAALLKARLGRSVRPFEEMTGCEAWRPLFAGDGASWPIARAESLGGLDITRGMATTHRRLPLDHMREYEARTMLDEQASGK